MERILPKKQERLVFFMYNFVLRIFLILLAAKLSQKYFPHGFWLYAFIAYLSMTGGAFIYRRMYVPIYKMFVIQDEKEQMPAIFVYCMLTLVMAVCVLGGLILFFQHKDVFTFVFVPFFVFMGALVWEISISRMFILFE
ncbi:MAG: hypothetical protein K6T72_01025 [Anoxybacillus sp.]|nr:hypothetical protein [Anoxybacillus sp.]MCL6585094.1 hypothetical protein [Anoxybacillus sp.]